MIDFENKSDLTDMEIKSGESTYYFYHILVVKSPLKTFRSPLNLGKGTMLFLLNYIYDSKALEPILRWSNNLSNGLVEIVKLFEKYGHSTIKQEIITIIKRTLVIVKWNPLLIPI